MFIILGVIIILAIFAISKNSTKKLANTDPENKIQITTSFYPLYFFTSQIAGDKAVVYNLTPAGSEPHDYELTTQDVARIEDSKLLILNGNKLEAWGEKIEDSLRGTGTRVIAVGEVIVDQSMVEDNIDINDPHVWLDPHLAEKEAMVITEALKQVDPSNTGFYQKNFELLQDKFSDLDEEFHLGLNNCLKKDMVTAHAAFGHLAREYNLNQVSISGLSPDEEPSPQKLAEVADFAGKNNIKYIFFESLVSPKLAQTVASEIGASTLVLNPIEGLGDSEIAQGKNYFTEMRNNLTNLKIALQCQ